MTRILTIGFESGTHLELPNLYSNQATPFAVSESVVRSGKYAADLGTSSTSRTVEFGKSFPATNSAFIGLGIYSTAFATSSGHSILNFRSGTTPIVAMWREADSSVYPTIRVNNVVVATSSIPYTLNEFSYWELGCFISGSSSWAELRKNGVVAARFDGLITGSIENFLFKSGNSSLTANNHQIRYVDDIILNTGDGMYHNSWPNQPRLYPKYITANGDISEWLRGGVDTGANFSQVNEDPANLASYLYSNTDDDEELFETSDLDAGLVPFGASINSVTVMSYAGTDSGSGYIANQLKVGEDVVESDLTGIASGAAFAGTTFPMDAGNIPWTIERVNTMQSGIIRKSGV
jgi:hypothetical protein